MDNTFFDLALEGERLCKIGQFHPAIRCLEEAICKGSEDKELLCIVSVELGNAYFCVGDFEQALNCHKHGLQLSRLSKSRVAEAYSWGYLGCALKALVRYDEGTVCCRQQLSIAKEIGDKTCEAKACYNLAGIFGAKAQQINCGSNYDPGHFPFSAEQELRSASEFYAISLKLFEEVGDKIARGRLYGCLGNVHYLLGEFSAAIDCHNKRLQLAREFSDRAAERRALMNIGNACTFLGDLEGAVINFKAALKLSVELGSSVLEAQTCFSLASVFVVLRDYRSATELYSRHLCILQQLCDCSGDEGRPCWHLAGTYREIGDSDRALDCARKHMEMTREEGDGVAVEKSLNFFSELEAMISTAKRSIKNKCRCGTDLIFDFVSVSSESGVSSSIISAESPAERDCDTRAETDSEVVFEGQCSKVARQSMERLDILPLTPEKTKSMKRKKNASVGTATNREKECFATTDVEKNDTSRTSLKTVLSDSEVDSFLNMISRVQGRRLDDQRTSSSPLNAPVTRGSIQTRQPQDENFLDLLSRSQSRRINDQRCSSSMLHPNGRHRSLVKDSGEQTNKENREPNFDPANENFLDLVANLHATQINDQRAVYPGVQKFPKRKTKSESVEPSGRRDTLSGLQPPDNMSNIEPPVTQQLPKPSPHTHPNEDFLTLIQRLQSSRLEDQRCQAPTVSMEKPIPVLPEPTPSKARTKSLTFGRSKQKSGRNSFK